MSDRQASLIATLRLSGPSICAEAAAEIERQAEEIARLRLEIAENEEALQGYAERDHRGDL